MKYQRTAQALQSVIFILILLFLGLHKAGAVPIEEAFSIFAAEEIRLTDDSETAIMADVRKLGKITDLNVGLEIFARDFDFGVSKPGLWTAFDITLRKQGGPSVQVLESSFGDLGILSATFDDEAQNELEPFVGGFQSGSFKPFSPLSVFDGTALSGNWELVVSGTGPFSEEIINFWTISGNVEQVVPEPSSSALFLCGIVSIIVGYGYRRTRHLSRGSK